MSFGAARHLFVGLSIALAGLALSAPGHAADRHVIETPDADYAGFDYQTVPKMSRSTSADRPASRPTSARPSPTTSRRAGASSSPISACLPDADRRHCRPDRRHGRPDPRARGAAPRRTRFHSRRLCRRGARVRGSACAVASIRPTAPTMRYRNQGTAGLSRRQFRPCRARCSAGRWPSPTTIRASGSTSPSPAAPARPKTGRIASAPMSMSRRPASMPLSARTR